MTVETRYKLGDSLFTISRDLRVVTFTVTQIFTFVREGSVNVSYSDDAHVSYDEKQCFLTEALLFNYLKRDGENSQ